MSREPIRTLEGLKGKKINIYGGPIGVGTAQALGFTPMHMNIPDVYLSVEKGVLDGVISSVSLITSRKFGEILKHYTSGPTFGGAPFVIVMYHDKWKELPLDIQKVFDEIGGVPGAELFGKGMVKDEQDGREGGTKKSGCEFYKLPSDELARWVKPLGSVQEQWVEEIIADDTDFYCHVFLSAGTRQGLWHKAGFRRVDRVLPMLFRDSADYGDPSVRVSEQWYVWKPNEPFRKVGRLTSDLRHAEIGVVVARDRVVERIRTGLYGFQYTAYDQALEPRA